MVTYIWIGMVCAAVVFGAASGRLEEVGKAAMDGAGAAVNVCLSMLAPMCLWSGVTELLNELGVMGFLNRVLMPAVGKLFPRLSSEGNAHLVSLSLAANMLGLGNAATPLTLKAAETLGKQCRSGVASRELCRLIVLNTASVQIIPMTVCGIRAGLGAESPFDIVPAVWVTSFFALSVGLGAMFVFEKLFGGKNG
ncbi:MAG: spore maturation protein A [Oscillospiraceae bacterium]|nr:spore maturation protein A [Oscillospiraceae bacterium]